MAPGITWKNGGADGAELATAAYVWGVGHPPGYPLYLALVRLVEALPLGEPIRAAAVFSGLMATLSVVLVYALTRRLLGQNDWRARVASGFAAAAFAFGPVFWSQAVIAEVYTFSSALLCLFLLALARWLDEPSRRRSLGLMGALAVLVSHHPPYALALVPLGWLAWRRRLPGSVVAQASSLLLIAPLLLLTLWLRASFEPPLAWGDPSSLDRWFAHITAAIYRPYFLAVPLLNEAPRVPSAIALVTRQAGWVATALAALGVSWLWFYHRAFTAIAALLTMYFAVFAILYNARDGEVYLLPTILLMALSAGSGANWLLNMRRWQPIVVASMGLTVAWQVLSTWSSVDVSHDNDAHAWITSTLAAAPRESVVHTLTDEHTFGMWYALYALGDRPDLAVIDDRLLQFDWYRHQILRQYPRLAGQGIADGPPVQAQRASRGDN
jgi:hypothetical protein